MQIAKTINFASRSIFSMSGKTTILAIESSCDDTAAAIIQDGHVLSNVVANQDVHKAYGGVIPELASRAHQAHLIPVVQQALDQAGLTVDSLDAVGFTRGPGLIGSLLVGVTFSKALALSLDIPLVEVNHMQAHVLAHFAENPKPEFPFLCLTVSGGHTQIVLVRDFLDMEVLGETLDDAAGEALIKPENSLDCPTLPDRKLIGWPNEVLPVFHFLNLRSPTWILAQRFENCNSLFPAAVS